MTTRYECPVDITVVIGPEEQYDCPSSDSESEAIAELDAIIGDRSTKGRQAHPEVSPRTSTKDQPPSGSTGLRTPPVSEQDHASLAQVLENTRLTENTPTTKRETSTAGIIGKEEGSPPTLATRAPEFEGKGGQNEDLKS